MMMTTVVTTADMTMIDAMAGIGRKKTGAIIAVGRSIGEIANGANGTNMAGTMIGVAGPNGGAAIG